MMSSLKPQRGGLGFKQPLKCGETLMHEKACLIPTVSFISFEPPHQKTNNLHMRKQRRRPASQ